MLQMDKANLSIFSKVIKFLYTVYGALNFARLSHCPSLGLYDLLNICIKNYKL